jgi:hypothetical protein
LTKFIFALFLLWMACQNAGGVKFHYCLVCQAPVAKDIFGRRHTHGGQKLPHKSSANNRGITTTTTTATTLLSDADAAPAPVAPTTSWSSKTIQ